MQQTVYTIGHSTRSLEELIESLQAHGIRMLVDIRAFPASRRLPHFNRESLEEMDREDRAAKPGKKKPKPRKTDARA